MPNATADPLRGVVVEAENERQHDQNRREWIVEHTMDDRGKDPAGHDLVEAEHLLHLLLVGWP